VSTTKVFTKTAIQTQTSSAYEENALFTLPVTSYKFMQKRNVIEDESYHGVAFQDTPQKGVNDTAGSISCNVDIISLAAYLSGITGYVSSGSYYFNPSTPNVIKYSLARRDGVSYKQYANVYAKSLKISGSADNLLSAELDLIGVTAEVRTSLGSYPSTTDADEAFSFHEMSGSGYFRVGDQSDALAAGDNLDIEDFEFNITTGYDSQHYNSYSILTPQMGQIRPSVEGSFKISQHSVDTFLTFRDNMTKLQLILNVYKTSTQQLIITVPNFIVDTELTDDEIARQGVTMKIGRNGIGTSYVNANIANVSPIIFQIINS
jgi:hypothetical protein